METQTVQDRQPPLPPGVVAAGLDDPDNNNHVGEVIAMILSPVEYLPSILGVVEVVHDTQQKEKS